MADVLAGDGFSTGVLDTPVEEQPDEYQARADFAKSLEVAYQAIRERVARGGPGWEPP